MMCVDSNAGCTLTVPGPTGASSLPPLRLRRRLEAAGAIYLRFRLLFFPIFRLIAFVRVTSECDFNRYWVGPHLTGDDQEKRE